MSQCPTRNFCPMFQKVDNPVCSIDFLKEQNILKFVWKDHIIGYDEFKKVVMQFADLALDTNAKYLYIDAIHNKVVMTKEVQKWHDEVIVAKYKQAGVKAIGFLIPKNIFSELTHKQTFENEKATQAINTRFFSSDSELTAWLLSHDK